jgi:hypothetical protein
MRMAQQACDGRYAADGLVLPIGRQYRGKVSIIDTTKIKHIDWLKVNDDRYRIPGVQHKGIINTIAFNRRGGLVASVGDDGGA